MHSTSCTSTMDMWPMAQHRDLEHFVQQTKQWVILHYKLVQPQVLHRSGPLATGQLQNNMRNKRGGPKQKKDIAGMNATAAAATTAQVTAWHHNISSSWSDRLMMETTQHLKTGTASSKLTWGYNKTSTHSAYQKQQHQQDAWQKLS